MSIESAKWRSLVPCSSTRESEKNHVIIYYPRYDTSARMRGLIVCVPVEDLINPIHTFPSLPEQMLPCPEGGVLNLNVSCICVNNTTFGPNILFCGGLDPYACCSWASMKEYVVKDVFSYDLKKFSSREMGRFKKCEDMTFGMSNPLLAQVGTSIYALGYGKMKDTDHLSLVFQKYDFRKNKWTSLSENLFDINKCDGPVCWFRGNFNRLPHIVIGDKLHISIGNSSFTYETKNNTWYDCELFETFWTKKIMKKKKSGRPSPLSFYGKEVWNGATKAAKKRPREPFPFGGGPPFGFRGRGILWDEDILLGIHHGDSCPVVAFQLDMSGRVLKSQSLSLDNLLEMQGGILPYGAHFVELGGDGYFGLVHFFGNEDMEEDDNWELTYRMELLTFKVEKVGASNNDNFLEVNVMSNEVIVEKLEDYSTASYLSAFCV